MVNIKIIEVKENKLLHRKHVSFEIEHFGSGSPNRIEVKEKLAALQTAKPELTFIKEMQPRFGLPQVRGEATIYEDEAVAMKLEPNYIKIRNLPKEKRDAAWKEVKAKKKKKKRKA